MFVHSEIYVLTHLVFNLSITLILFVNFTVIIIETVAINHGYKMNIRNNTTRSIPQLGMDFQRIQFEDGMDDRDLDESASMQQHNRFTNYGQ